MKPTINHIAVTVFSFSLLFGQGCSTLPESKSHSFDPRHVESMSFALENTSLLNRHLPTTEIHRQVTQNLGEWGYVFAQDFTHVLNASIGKVERGDAPVGFSYAVGNSNPRSPNYQQLDVLPFYCTLTPKNHPSDKAALTLEVMAEDYVKYSQSTDKNSLLSELTNDISTACFNLLSSLRVKTVQPLVDESGSVKRKTHSWIPEIRIEVEDVPEPSQVPSPSVPSTATDGQKPAAAELSDTEQPVTTPQSGHSIKVEEKPRGKTRKRIIIHNQGSPLILQFGHERK